MNNLSPLLSLLFIRRSRWFIRWFLVQLFIDARFLGKPWFLTGAGVQPGAAGLSVVARFVPHVLPRARVDVVGPDLLLVFIEQRGGLRRELRCGALDKRLLCAREVLYGSLGVATASQLVSGFTDGVCGLLVGNHRDQFDVLDDVRFVLRPLDSNQMGTGPAFEPQ